MVVAGGNIPPAQVQPLTPEGRTARGFTLWFHWLREAPDMHIRVMRPLSGCQQKQAATVMANPNADGNCDVAMLKRLYST
jgi:hypothetical protein